MCRLHFTSAGLSGAKYQGSPLTDHLKPYIYGILLHFQQVIVGHVCSGEREQTVHTMYPCFTLENSELTTRPAPKK